MDLNKNLHLAHKLFTPTVDTGTGRDAFGEALAELGEQNENVVVLSADLSESTKASKFAKKFPKRFFQVGVAEQNMAGIAAGLGLSGKIPFMTSFGVFSPGRNWDQIKVSICYSHANVKICSSHLGLSNGPDGATHHALEDLAMLRVLPNLLILSPADALETKKAVFAAAKHNGPVYIRYSKVDLPIFTTTNTPFEIGKAQVLTEGTDLTVIATGPSVYDALSAANQAFEKHKVSCEVINCSTIKPLDTKTILESARKTKKVLTVEEHHKIGGLGSAIAELLSQQLPTPLTILGVDDIFTKSGEYNQLKDKYGIAQHNILEKIVQ